MRLNRVWLFLVKNMLVQTRKVTVLLYPLNDPVCMCEARARGWTISFRGHISRAMTDWCVPRPKDKEELRIKKGSKVIHLQMGGPDS